MASVIAEFLALIQKISSLLESHQDSIDSLRKRVENLEKKS